MSQIKIDDSSPTGAFFI